MELKEVALTIGTGFVAFLLVGVAVTSGLDQWIAFSLIIGIPAGIVAGVLTGGAVAYRLANAGTERRHRIQNALTGFVAGFGLTLLVLAVVWNSGLTFALSTALLVGFLGLLIGYAWDSLSGTKRVHGQV